MASKRKSSTPQTTRRRTIMQVVRKVSALAALGLAFGAAMAGEITDSGVFSTGREHLGRFLSTAHSSAWPSRNGKIRNTAVIVCDGAVNTSAGFLSTANRQQGDPERPDRPDRHRRARREQHRRRLPEQRQPGSGLRQGHAPSGQFRRRHRREQRGRRLPGFGAPSRSAARKAAASCSGFRRCSPPAHRRRRGLPVANQSVGVAK